MKFDPETPGYMVMASVNPVTGQPNTAPGATPNLAGSTDSVTVATTINAQNTAPTGAAPAGSALQQGVNGRATASFQITANTLTVALSLQASLDGATWSPVGGPALIRQSDGALVTSIPAGATGLYTAAVADFEYVRLSTPNSATTGSATVTGATTTAPTVVTVDNLTQAPAGTPGVPAAFALVANTNTQILAANTARRGAMIRNDSGQPVFLRFGATAAASNLYSVELVTGSYYELPFGITAAIQALSTLAGSAVAAGVGLFVTEFTS